MNPVMKEIFSDVIEDEREKIAIEMLEDGTLSIPKIAKFSKLSENKIEELAEQLKAPVEQ